MRARLAAVRVKPGGGMGGACGRGGKMAGMSDPPFPPRRSGRARHRAPDWIGAPVAPIGQGGTVRRDDEALQLATPPDMPAGAEPTVAAELLADTVALDPGARVLIIGAGNGTLPLVIARRVPVGAVTIADPSYLALMLTRATLAANDITHATLVADPSRPLAPPGTIDVVLLTTPPDRRLSRRWLLAAVAALRPGGRLYLAGANDHGVRSVIADAATLFAVTSLALRQRHRVALAVQPAAPLPVPAWATESGIAPGTWDEFTVQTRGLTLPLRSLPGVFARGRLDPGTALLLDVLAVPPGGSVLDAGCGAGIIGLVAARLGASRVDLVDVNLLAVAAARENVARGGYSGLRVLPSDILSAVPDERYDLIVSNPPFHTGKAVDDRFAVHFVPQAAAALAPGGRVLVVTNSFIRYDRALRQQIGPTAVLAETGQYRVLQATARG